MQRASRLSLVGAWAELRSRAQRKRSRGRFLCRRSGPISITVCPRHTRPLASLASKYGSTGEIFFPTSAAKVSRRSRRMSRSPHLLLVKGATAGAVIVVVRMEEIVVSEVTEEIVVSVRKETDRVGTGVLVHRARAGHRVRREIVRRVRKESAWSVGRVRKEIVRHVRHAHRARTGHRVRKESAESVGHVLSRLRQTRSQRRT